MNAMERYGRWMEKLPAEDPLRKELALMEGLPDQIEDSFYQDLAFGTAGLRGKVGAGTNRMNALVVGRATRGLADYICAHGQEAMDRGVIIAHDPRHFSHEFSLLAAEILAGCGIRAYIFPDLRPTPELAFLIRKLGTVSGINITASHNPREYNGYKVYWEDGCQVSSTVADGIYECISRLDYFDDFGQISLEEGKAKDLIRILGEKEDREYLDRIEALAIHEGEELDLSIPLVYTPLNGAGSVPFVRMLQDRGFNNWHIVEEQRYPDPDFTTVGYPNPEAPAAFAMSEALGHQVGAELLMATDPDSDRFAIEILSDKGEYIPLNGNQTGYILVNYILEGHLTAGTLPAKGAMVRSIVTSSLSSIIAKHYGVEMFEALTGFKNICGRIPFLHENGYTYLFGYEESVGYAACEDIRDKDGISAGMLVAEAAAYYRKQGKTLWQVLQEIYEKYGYFYEDEPNLVLQGIEGARRIGRMMDALRSDPIRETAGLKVVRTIDYQNGWEDIPASNVMRYELEEGSWFAIRPSGTEPKIKFYFYSVADCARKAADKGRAVKEDILERLQKIQ